MADEPIGHHEIREVSDVANYLVAEYDISEIRAAELVEKHRPGIEEAAKNGSFVYFVGEVIADEEGLEPKEFLEDEEDIAAEADDT